jgi:hypothetical protein
MKPAWLEVHYQAGLWLVTVCSAQGGARVDITAELLRADALALAHAIRSNTGLPVHETENL